ncbi:hypothetical protein DH2020_035023 [Rehmannia glutinosa]|uniref:At1g61320/AtMIF1 LRR domain-containing protein n=1 Tax=Rehmannia glutinosa TaxID=99300 RepID=A0ABR0V8K2_REHGL
MGISTFEKERWNYTKWVNQVIALHESSTVEGFRVYFNLDKTYQKYIDKWLRYALARKVRRLELDLIDRSCYGFRNYDENYTFPYKYLHTDEGNCSNDSLTFSMRQRNSIHFKYLEKVSLKYVNVNGEALEFFLCNCPLLEDLFVSHSGQLSNLNIIGALPSFKRLEISRCFNLNSVEIRDANLEIQVLYSSVKMRNLKHLVVNVRLSSDDSLLPLTKLMCASPCLQSFALELLKACLSRKAHKALGCAPHSLPGCEC